MQGLKDLLVHYQEGNDLEVLCNPHKDIDQGLMKNFHIDYPVLHNFHQGLQVQSDHPVLDVDFLLVLHGDVGQEVLNFLRLNLQTLGLIWTK